MRPLAPGVVARLARGHGTAPPQRRRGSARAVLCAAGMRALPLLLLCSCGLANVSSESDLLGDDEAALAVAPDLIVTAFSMSPADPAPGEPVTFSATVRNRGYVPTPANVITGVVFSVDGAVVTWSDNHTASIPARSSVTVTASGGPAGARTWAAVAGPHSIDVWVNDAKRYDEAFFGNNHLVLPFEVREGEPDLVVASVTPLAPMPGQVVRFSAKLENRGTGATPAGVKNGVVFTLDGTVLGWSDDDVSSIPPGGSVTVTQNFGSWTATPGAHTLDAWVNDAKRYEETDFTNNHLVVPVNVVANGRPDLVVSSWGPAAPTAGQSVRFTATIRNQGTAPTPAGVKNGVVFTVDGSFVTWSDDHTTSIPVGGSATVTVNFTPWTATAGTHSIDVWVNDAKRYPELDETNNHLLGTITVGGGTTPPPSTGAGPTGQNAADWIRTFTEEFDTFDTARWNDRIWYEQSNPTKNYTVSNGSLKIWPQRDASGNFFNRTIDTDGKYYQTYGYFEIEAKLPRGVGTWPAFWLFNHIGARRPEIDIMEAYPGGVAPWGITDSSGIRRPTAFAATIWLDANQNGGSKQLATPDLSAGFHKYGLLWEANRQTFYFDGQPFYVANVSMGDPMYIMLDLWFGSASGTPTTAGTPQGITNSYEVNYVRAWRRR